MSKKKCLISVSAAAAIVAAGATTSFAKNEYEGRTGKTYQGNNGIISDLLMESPDTQEQAVQFAGHSSHSSHGSHGSHGSHSSHSSGY